MDFRLYLLSISGWSWSFVVFLESDGRLVFAIDPPSHPTTIIPTLLVLSSRQHLRVTLYPFLYDPYLIVRTDLGSTKLDGFLLVHRLPSESFWTEKSCRCEEFDTMRAGFGFDCLLYESLCHWPSYSIHLIFVSQFFFREKLERWSRVDRWKSHTDGDTHMRTLVFISSLHSGHLFLLLFFESSQKNIIQNGPHFRLERLPQQHQQCREARQASGLDPSFLEGHCQVLVLDAEAWYVSFNIFYVVFFSCSSSNVHPPQISPEVLSLDDCCATGSFHFVVHDALNLCLFKHLGRTTTLLTSFWHYNCGL